MSERNAVDRPSDVLPHAQRRARRPASNVRLRRSRRGAVLGGIASGIAAFLGVRTWTVRTAFVIASIASWGIFAVGYPLLWLLLPREPEPRLESATVATPHDGVTGA